MSGYALSPTVILGVRDIIEAEKNGQTFFSGWRKQPTQTTAAGIWFDLSMSPGNPVPNYYIGPSGVFTPLRQSTDGGIPHGPNVSPQKKFLRVFEAQTATATAVPLPLWLLDYLGFYPFIDESITDEQFMDNTAPLPRSADGKGVQILPVVVAGHIGGQTLKVSYTNQDGVANRWTPQHLMGTQIVNGTIITSAGSAANSRAPFMALQAGDTGVRQVDSVIFEGTGDIGLISLALVKPVARHYIRGIDAPTEQDFFMDSSSLPQIADDAYLNLISLPSGTLAAAPIMGYIKTLWA
jgi:hypothetical protein